LRRVAAAVLLLGLTAAAATYWIETARAQPTLEDLYPGSNRAERRQLGQMFGPSYLTVIDLGDDLLSPSGQALMVAAASCLAAGICRRAARFADEAQAAFREEGPRLS
jgi:hypothetical protein